MDSNENYTEVNQEGLQINQHLSDAILSRYYRDNVDYSIFLLCTFLLSQNLLLLFGFVLKIH